MNHIGHCLRPFVLVSGILSFAGCNDLLDVSCPSIFRVFSVTVVDTVSLTPVAGMHVDVVSLTHGDTLQFDALNGGGSYVVMDDSHRDRLSEGEELFRVTGVSSAFQFRMLYRFEARGEECRQIVKLAGPDSILVP